MLPQEIQVMICCTLDDKDILNLGETEKYMNGLTRDDNIWKCIFLNYYTINNNEDKEEGETWYGRYIKYRMRSKVNERQKKLLERLQGGLKLKMTTLKEYEQCRIPSKNIIEPLDHILVCIREKSRGYIGKMTNINEGQYIVREFHSGGNLLGAPIGAIGVEQRKELEQVGVIERQRRTKGSRYEKESIIFMNKYQLKNYK